MVHSAGDGIFDSEQLAGNREKVSNLTFNVDYIAGIHGDRFISCKQSKLSPFEPVR